ncbi:5305_t:CDS:2, partial [Acaulospora colombiana]
DPPAPSRASEYRCPIDANIQFATQDGGGASYVVPDTVGHQSDNDGAVRFRLEAAEWDDPRGNAERTALRGHLRDSTPTVVANVPCFPEADSRSGSSPERVASAPSARMPPNPGFSTSRPEDRFNATHESHNVGSDIASHMVASNLGDSVNSTTVVPQRIRLEATVPSSFVPTSVRSVSSVMNAASITLTNGPRQQRTPSLSCRQLLQQRLQKYKLGAKFDVEYTGPQHAQSWSITFKIGDYEVGRSSWHSSKDAAKEEAASCALAWMNQYAAFNDKLLSTLEMGPQI